MVISRYWLGWSAVSSVHAQRRCFLKSRFCHRVDSAILSATSVNWPIRAACDVISIAAYGCSCCCNSIEMTINGIHCNDQYCLPGDCDTHFCWKFELQKEISFSEFAISWKYAIEVFIGLLLYNFDNNRLAILLVSLGFHKYDLQLAEVIVK